MKEKLKILAAADLHGDLALAMKLSEKASKNEVDLVILAGDINGFVGNGLEVLEIFKKNNHKVIFVPGNWDTKARHIAMAEKAINIDKAYVNYKGVGIAGIGTDWSFSLEESDFEKIGDNFGKMDNRKKILVSHMHAKDTKAEFSGFSGDKILRDVVFKFKPDILIAAHIHEAEGLEDLIGKTKVFQVGRIGKIIEL
ncbi:MAG: metallophosphoesterase family protein [Nanoarchaeota archaeon]|nr:metallophosphoesterase family protein [Nanoarchaeota archaeon]